MSIARCLGCRVPRVNLTDRWVTQHTASCPLAGVVGCVLPACVQGLVEPDSRWLGEGENKWSSSWGCVLLLLILVFALLVSTWIHIRRGVVTEGSAHPAWRCTSPRGVVPVGLGDGVGASSPIFQESVFLVPFCIFLGEKLYSFFRVWFLIFGTLLGMLVAEWEPTPCYRDAYSVGTPKWAYWGKGWQKHFQTTFSPSCGRFFLVSKGTIFSFGKCYCMDVPYCEGQAS